MILAPISSTYNTNFHVIPLFKDSRDFISRFKSRAIKIEKTLLLFGTHILFVLY